MKILEYVGETIGLIQEALQVFINAKKANEEFVAPFIMSRNNNELVTLGLDEFTVPCILDTLKKMEFAVHGFVLAGETQLHNPKTGREQRFFVVKLVVDGLENCYVYSVPFFPGEDNSRIDQMTMRYAGSEPNTFFSYKTIPGEESSLNAIKMDDIAPYHYRAAFLMGHFNEDRLWFDAMSFMADTYCKLVVDSSHRYDFIFEVSKFGAMTDSMLVEFERVSTFFAEEFEPLFKHIDGKMKLENTTHSGHPN